MNQPLQCRELRFFHYIFPQVHTQIWGNQAVCTERVKPLFFSFFLNKDMYKEKHHRITSPTSIASSVKVATVKTTPNSPSTATVIAWASLATSTAALDASLSRIHSIPEKVKINLFWQSRIAINNNWSPWIQGNPNEHIDQLVTTNT